MRFDLPDCIAAPFCTKAVLGCPYEPQRKVVSQYFAARYHNSHAQNITLKQGCNTLQKLFFMTWLAADILYKLYTGTSLCCRQHWAGFPLRDVLLLGQAARGELPAQQATQKEGRSGCHDQGSHARVGSPPSHPHCFVMCCKQTCTKQQGLPSFPFLLQS